MLCQASQACRLPRGRSLATTRPATSREMNRKRNGKISGIVFTVLVGCVAGGTIDTDREFSFSCSLGLGEGSMHWHFVDITNDESDSTYCYSLPYNIGKE